MTSKQRIIMTLNNIETYIFWSCILKSINITIPTILQRQTIIGNLRWNNVEAMSVVIVAVDVIAEGNFCPFCHLVKWKIAFVEEHQNNDCPLFAREIYETDLNILSRLALILLNSSYIPYKLTRAYQLTNFLVKNMVRLIK